MQGEREDPGEEIKKFQPQQLKNLWVLHNVKVVDCKDMKDPSNFS